MAQGVVLPVSVTVETGPTEGKPAFDLGLRTWKRLDYLIHRWIGLVLGIMVLVWFGSGFVMAYYRWPALTESQRDRILQPFTPDPSLIGFAAAREAAERSARPAPLDFFSGRLLLWNGRLTYDLRGTSADEGLHQVLVDAHTGAVTSPISAEAAVGAARQFSGSAARVTEVARLERGDLYTMNTDYAADFPAYRARFDDPVHTAVYVNEESGIPVALVTAGTRLTTWFGTVPHWLYIPPLYHRRPIWRFVNIVLPSIAAILSLTGIVLGFAQLLPHRARGDGQLSPYRGLSRWHHLAGVVAGLLVLVWTSSAVFQMVGSSLVPQPALASRVRGPGAAWSATHLTERQALQVVTTGIPTAPRPIRVDLVQLAGRLGYDIRLEDGREAWVDAVDGSVRGMLTESEARSVAARALDASIGRADQLNSYDRYYYARPGRELHLPVWRVGFRDDRQSVIYLDAFTGMPVGYVDPRVRRWRWLRDGLHSFDYPALNNKRPLWDFVVLPLLGAGLLSALTGTLLAIRRARRMSQRVARNA